MSGVELARWAVACPVWRWMPGMRTTEGALVVSCADGIPTEVVFDGALMPAVWAGRGVTLEVVHNGIARGSWYVLDGALPDLDDPATLGCLLALVREAWSEPEAFVTRAWKMTCKMASHGRAPWCLVAPSSVGRDPDSEKEALVAALEAAPRREVAP